MANIVIKEPAPLPSALEPAAAVFEDAHQLWHDAADSYHDVIWPPGFIPGLLDQTSNLH